MSQYHIYQTDADYRFLWWEAAKDKFTIDDYHKIYSGELIDAIKYGNETTVCNEDDYEVLEKLFETFNINRPEDYNARSLSVSDIVEIRRKDITRYYYCGNMGWKLIGQNRLERKVDVMITDGVLGAVQMIIDRFETPEEVNAGEIIWDMLSDYDEDEWRSMSNEEKAEWIADYVRKVG